MARHDPDSGPVDESPAPEELFERFPEASPDEVIRLADDEDEPPATPTERAVGELLADGLTAEHLQGSD